MSPSNNSKTKPIVRGFCIIAVIILVSIGVIYLIGLDPEENEEPFDNGGRYDSSILNNMGVIYNNRSDIVGWNNAYSESDNCPWGGEHNGLDFMYYNNSIVIAAAPGIVQEIEVGYLEAPFDTIYFVTVKIKFNESVWVNYGFEGDSTDVAARNLQLSMIDVQEGDWVAKGDQIGRFLRPTECDHIHFSVYKDDIAFCPSLVMGVSDYNEIMAMIQPFHSDWDLCYP